ncbi:MAG: hypothetical protein A2Y40_02710 [Candidatus Margulisbacteria bacterium GWF2_35_9]|nr:MAG: hypothetical protein A2Y40_02710 [Candidatus Margulisbacteria bacterium GWF2_35_9]
MKLLKTGKNVKTDLFNFSFSRSTTLLETSIKTNGLAQLPYGIVVHDSIQIYEGLKRYTIALELGLDIDIIVKELSIKEAFLEKIRMSSTKYNPIECAAILTFANTHHIDYDLFIKYLGINIENAAAYLKLLTLPLSIQQKTATEPEFLKVSQLLLPKHEKDILEIYDIIINYKLNINQSYELCQIIDELRLKDASFKLDSLLNLEINSANSAQEFMTHIKHIRYPNYMQLKSVLNNALKSIKSSHIRFDYKDNFESDEVSLTASIRAPQDIEKIISELETNKNVITKLLSIIKRGTH